MEPPSDTRVDLPALLSQDYWLILSTPLPAATELAVTTIAPEHVQWLLGLEQQQVLFLSGPLLSGPHVGPGSGVTILRARDEDEATRIAEQDPFVKAGLRSFAAFQWRLNEGSVSVCLSLGTGRYNWQ